MSPIEYGAVFLVMAVAAGLQGGVGFGMNVLAAPVAALVEPRLVPGPLVFGALTLTLLMARRELAHVEWRGLGWFTLGRVPGSTAGALFLAALPLRAVALTVGASVLLAALLSLTRLALRPTPGTLVGAGVVSGFGGTVSSIGGPVVAVVYSHSSGPVIRATLSAIFVFSSVISLVALTAVGRLGSVELRLALLIVPPIVLGYASSGWLARHLDQGRTRKAVLSVSVVGALVVIASALV